MNRRTAALGAILALVVAGCSSDATGPSYSPDLPASWASAISNPYLSFVPGTIYEYESQTAEGLETITIEVLSQTRQIQGATATIVRDQVFLDGSLVEDTYDWYAQDPDGNVWYLGEDSKEIENGQVINAAGSWEWGVDGALPGIIMWADPAAHAGESYRQEYYKGEAEDWGKVLESGVSVTVPGGSFSGCIKTADWSSISPGLESKYYCPQVGLVLEEAVGSGERLELISRTLPAAMGRNTTR